MTPKWSNLDIVLSYWNEKMNQNFRFNNPKECSNWIILVSFCSTHLAIKNCYNVLLWKFKKLMQKSICLQKIQKVCVLQRRACNKFKFQMQLSRKLQRFRTCRKNKKTLHFSWSFRIYHFSYGCKLLDWIWGKF